VAVEVVQLVLASFTPYVKVPTTTAANVLAMVVTLPMLLLSHLEHCKALRPSSILCTYLFFTLLLDIPRVRTLWMSHQWVPASATLQAAMVIKVSILLLELQTKVRMLVQTDRDLSPEETSNVFSRRLFWWLNQLFRKGYSKPLSLPDLYVLDEDLASKTVGTRLEMAWNSRRGFSLDCAIRLS
jgi:ATP-binding cassette subfamily C (CFTR/MRP) protein 1